MSSISNLRKLPEHGSCFICGKENPHSVGLTWFIDEEGVVSSEFTLTLSQQGPPGYAHGGLSAAVLDEVMGAAVWQAGHTVVVANMDIDFRKPVPLKQPIKTVGYITHREGKKIYAKGEVLLPDGTTLVEGTGLYVEAPHLFESNNMFRSK